MGSPTGIRRDPPPGKVRPTRGVLKALTLSFAAAVAEVEESLTALLTVVVRRVVAVVGGSGAGADLTVFLTTVFSGVPFSTLTVAEGDPGKSPSRALRRTLRAVRASFSTSFEALEDIAN